MYKKYLNKKNYSVQLIFLLLIASFSSQYMTFVIFLLYIFIHLIKNNFCIKYKHFPGEKAYFTIFLLLFIVGVLYLGKIEWSFIRDAIRYIYIFIYWEICNLIAYKCKYNKNYIIKSVIFYCGIYCTFNLLVKFYYVLTNINGENLFYIFTSRGRIDEFTLAIGLYLLIFKPFDDKDTTYISKKIDAIFRWIMVLALILSFSRTTFLILVFFILFSYRHRLKLIIKYGMITVSIIILVSYFIPTVYNVFLEKVLSSFTEISSNYNEWNEYLITNNWRGYEVYCAKQQFSNYSILNKIFGVGFGTGIDVGKYSYMVTQEDLVPYLHNGYYTMLIKGGLVGMLLNIYFYLAMLLDCTKITDKKYRNFWISMVLSIIITTVGINGILWGGCELIVLMLLRMCMIDDTIPLLN